MDRTGGPTQLMTLLPGLGQALAAHITLLHGPDGPLTATVRPHVDRAIAEPWILRGVARVERGAPKPLAGLLHRLWAAGMRLRVGRIDVVYVNSLISIRLARPFADRPTVVHVHELGGLADSFGAPAKQLVQTADRILVPSAAALRWVICSGRSAGDVEVLPGAVPPSALEPPTHEAVRALTIRLGITDGDGLIVSTVGWVGALKGSDRFIEVAALLADRLDQPVRFLWVGGGSATEQEQRFRSEIVARGLDAVVTILPAIDDLRPLYALSDVVLLTSREESLSLVALESAAQGTAVVAFPGAGGPDSLAEEGIVICPSTTDVGQVVETILELLLATDRRLALGVEARELVIANHGAAAGQRQLVRVLAEVAGR